MGNISIRSQRPQFMGAVKEKGNDSSRKNNRLDKQRPSNPLCTTSITNKTDVLSNDESQKALVYEINLSELDFKLVRSSWKELQSNDLRIYGTNMMVKIFLKHPEVKHLWKFAATLNNEKEMRESAPLRSHGNNVFEAINAAVNSLDKIDALNSSLNELGYRHSMYGAKNIHFPIITEALIETISEALEPNFTEEHRIAWEKITQYIVEQMSKQMD